MNNGNAGGCICSNKDKNFKANHNTAILGALGGKLYL